MILVRAEIVNMRQKSAHFSLITVARWHKVIITSFIKLWLESGNRATYIDMAILPAMSDRWPSGYSARLWWEGSVVRSPPWQVFHAIFL